MEVHMNKKAMITVCGQYGGNYWVSDLLLITFAKLCQCLVAAKTDVVYADSVDDASKVIMMMASLEGETQTIALNLIQNEKRKCTMELSVERQAEIYRALLKRSMKQEGLRLHGDANENARRSACKVAKEIGIP